MKELRQITEEMNAEKEREEMKAYCEANPTLAIKRSKSNKEEEKREKKEGKK